MLEKLLTVMDRRRFDPTVISLKDASNIGASIAALGIPVLECNMQSTNFASGFLKLLHNLRRIKPDIVQTWLYHADLLGGLAARATSVPHVVWNIRHSNLDPDKNKRMTLAVIRLNAFLSRHLPSHILSNSREAAEAHRDIGFDLSRCSVIPNGFDCERFRPDDACFVRIRSELGIPHSSPLVGMIARYDRQKNHKGFIEAARMIATQRPDALFMMAGREVTQGNPQLQGWIHEAGLTGQVRLLGERDDIACVMAALDVAVSTSWGEGFPNAVGEAMACGIPCVVTDVGACAELVGSTGGVARPGDMSAVAVEVIRMLQLTPEERQNLGLAARERILTWYSVSAVAKQYEDLYDHLTATKGKSNAAQATHVRR